MRRKLAARGEPEHSRASRSNLEPETLRPHFGATSENNAPESHHNGHNDSGHSNQDDNHSDSSLELMGAISSSLETARSPRPQADPKPMPSGFVNGSNFKPSV